MKMVNCQNQQATSFVRNISTCVLNQVSKMRWNNPTIDFVLL